MSKMVKIVNKLETNEKLTNEEAGILYRFFKNIYKAPDKKDTYKAHYPFNLLFFLKGDYYIPSDDKTIEEVLFNLNWVIDNTGLSELERSCIRFTFADELTFSHIAMMVNKSEAQVRRIVQCSLQKLRHPSRYKRIFGGVGLAEAVNRAKFEYDTLLAHYQIETNKMLDNPDGLDLKIIELELSVRSFNCLKRAEIKTLGDICNMDVNELFAIRNLGRKSGQEILDKVHSLGYKLKGE